MRIEQNKDVQLKGPENVFNKIIEENFPNIKREKAIKVQEAYRTPNKWDQRRKSSNHIITKRLNEQSKESIKSCKGKRSSNIKVDLSELHQTSQQRLSNPEEPDQRSCKL